MHAVPFSDSVRVWAGGHDDVAGVASIAGKRWNRRLRRSQRLVSECPWRSDPRLVRDLSLSV